MVKDMETWVLTYMLNALWQVPLVFAAAWLAALGARRRDAALEHRIWVSALILESVLPACSLRLEAVLRFLTLAFAGRPASHAATVAVVTGAGQAQSGLRMSPLALHAVLVLYLAIVLYFALRLAVLVYRTLRLRATAQPVELDETAQASFHRMSRIFGVEDAILAASAEVCGPVVLGIWRQVLMLPLAMTSRIAPEDFAAALAHEFAHLRRRDFAKNLVYELLSLPVGFHPLLWPTRVCLSATREVLCDALAADAVHGRQQYARSLLRLASSFSERTRSIPTHAIGIFDANSFASFERRVMKLKENKMEVYGLRRVAMVTACLVLGLGACASALALRMQVAAPGQPEVAQKPVSGSPVVMAVPRSASGSPVQTFVIDMPSGPGGGGTVTPAPVRILTPTTVAADETVSAAQVSAGVMAGNILTKVTPVYPQEAKDAGIEGAVVLRAVIAKDGTITGLQLVSGPEELTKSAWEAVKQWVYKPYLLNGEPTEVETTITVNYSLAR